MKSFNTIMLILVTLLSCSSEKPIDNSQKDNTIIGQWQLIASKIGSTNNGGNWVEEENGYIMRLLNDGSFQSNQQTACENELNIGTFSFSESEKQITITIECSTANNEFVREFTYAFDNDNLILSPQNPPCPEGCSYKFLRLSTE